MFRIPIYLRKRAKTLTAGGTHEHIFSTGGRSSSAFGNKAEIINCKVKSRSNGCKHRTQMYMFLTRSVKKKTHSVKIYMNIYLMQHNAIDNRAKVDPTFK